MAFLLYEMKKIIFSAFWHFENESNFANLYTLYFIVFLLFKLHMSLPCHPITLRKLLNYQHSHFLQEVTFLMSLPCHLNVTSYFNFHSPSFLSYTKKTFFFISCTSRNMVLLVTSNFAAMSSTLIF